MKFHWRISLVVALSAVLAAEDVAIDEATEEARTQSAIETTLEGSKASQRRGAFSLSVVDQWGHPVPGVEIKAFTNHVDASMLPKKSAEGENPLLVENMRGRSDDRGRVAFDVGVFLQFGSVITSLPEGCMFAGKSSPRSWGIDTRELQAPEGNVVHKFDHTFTVYRLEGPQMLAHWKSKIIHPGDGSNVAWNALSKGAADGPAYGNADTWTGPQEFTVRAWRDPMAPKPDMSAIDLVVPPATWWVEVSCCRGGIMVSTKTPAFLAPEDGYQKTLRWEMDPSRTPYGETLQRTLYWRRLGTPLRYGCIDIGIRWSPKQMQAEISAEFWMNIANGRLLERPLAAGQTAEWVHESTIAERRSWMAEPFDPAAFATPPK